MHGHTPYSEHLCLSFGGKTACATKCDSNGHQRPHLKFQEMLDFISEGRDGLIVLSLGTTVTPESIPRKALTAVGEALGIVPMPNYRETRQNVAQEMEESYAETRVKQ